MALPCLACLSRWLVKPELILLARNAVEGVRGIPRRDTNCRGQGRRRPPAAIFHPSYLLPIRQRQRDRRMDTCMGEKRGLGRCAPLDAAASPGDPPSCPIVGSVNHSPCKVMDRHPAPQRVPGSPGGGPSAGR